MRDADVDDDGGESSCPGFAMLCDGFETGDLGLWDGARWRGDATLTFSGARVRSGALSLEAQMAMSADDGAAAAYLRFPAQTTGALAVRAWINLARPLERFNLILGMTNPVTGQYLSVGGDANGRWVTTEHSSSQMLGDHHAQMATPPLDTWTCVELVFTFPQAGASRLQLFVDEVAVLDEPGGDPAPTYTEIVVGGMRFVPDSAHVHVDDVVIARERIHCQ